MLCPKCGNEVHAGDVICLECGTLLTNTYVPLNSDSDNEESGSDSNQKVNVVESQNVSRDNSTNNIAKVPDDSSMYEQTVTSNATTNFSNVQTESSMNYTSNMNGYDYNQVSSMLEETTNPNLDVVDNSISNVQEEDASNQPSNVDNIFNQTSDMQLDNQTNSISSIPEETINPSFDTMNNSISSVQEDSALTQPSNVDNIFNQTADMQVDNQANQMSSMPEEVINPNLDIVDSSIPSVQEDSTLAQSSNVDNIFNQTPNIQIDNQTNSMSSTSESIMNSNYDMINDSNSTNQYQNYNNIESVYDDNNMTKIEPSYTDNSIYTNNDTSYLNNDRVDDIPKFDMAETSSSNDNIFNGFEMNSTVTPEQMAANVINNNEANVYNDINQNINQDVTMDNYNVNNDYQNISTMNNATDYSASNDVTIDNINQVSSQTNLQENVIPVVPTPNNNVVPTVIPQMDQKLENNNQPEEIKNEKVKPIKEKKKKNTQKNNVNKKGLLIIISVVVAILIIAMVCYYYFSKKSPSEYTLNDDKIPSVTSIVGSRNLDSTSNSNENDVVVKKYHYTKIKNVMSDLYQYINYLTGSLNYINTTAYDLNEETGTVQLGNDSKTSGYVVIVNIEYGPDDYTITVRKAPGTLTRY